MFKWIIKTWKIWRLNRRWYEVYYYENGGEFCYVKVCFGKRLHQMCQDSPLKLLVRKRENEWYIVEDTRWTGYHLKNSSEAIEDRYREYMGELAELNLL